MSRLTEDLINPAQKFFEWDGRKGGFEFWDKSQKTETVKGVKVHVPLPFVFLFLEKLSTIRGFNDDEQSGYWSNEVMDISKEVMVVRTKKEVTARGIYKNVIDSKECRGAKFCQSVYVGYKEGGKLVIANMQLTGAALSAGFEFCKSNDIKKGAIAVKSFVAKKKGDNNYVEPVFTKVPCAPETETAANVLCQELETYLAKYFKKQKEQNADINVSDVIIPAENNNTVAHKEESHSQVADIVSPGDDDLPF